MISAGNRDGRKGLEQGFSSNEREIDETELEEGEACSYQDDDEAASIDPDIALSYIDEKLQNVLGHFQKDFEGVVSAENLGAKYGIYGSFLPAYRRSPVWSQPISPPRVQNHTTTQSPSALRVEGGNHTSLAQSSVPHSLKHGSASAGSTSSYANKPPSQSGLCRRTTKTQSMQSLEECTTKSEACDQRTLKVRIKVGSDNLLVNKNAAIYSGLGLDGSPSSSFDESPAESEGLSRGLPSSVHESPSQILQIMTLFPLFGGYLLSPLPDDIIQLSEGPKVLNDILRQSSSKTNHRNSVVGHPCNSIGDNKSFSWEDGKKLLDRKGLPLQVKTESKDSTFDFSLTETVIDAAACEELVSNALKLPLLSDTYVTIGDSMKDSLKEKVSDAAEREPLEPVTIPFSLSDRSNGKADAAGNVLDTQLLYVPDERMSDSRKIRDGKCEANNGSTNSNIVGLKFKKTSKGGFKDPVKQKADKPCSSESGMGLPCANKQLSSGDKKKSKRSQVHSPASKKAGMESANNQARVQKNKQYGDNEVHASKSELESFPWKKELSKASDKYSKASDTYKDFFGDINEQETDIMDSPDLPFGHRLKTSEAVEKATLTNENTFKESWVECEKCKKWRLLPPGTNLDSLPEKWDCTMLNWLPDMNQCCISFEETTKAVRAHYQLLTENSNSLDVPPDRLASGLTSADNLDSSMLNDEKMTDKLRKTSKFSVQDSSHRHPSFIKKKQQSAKDRTLVEAKESPVMNRPDFLQQSKSSDTYVDTNEQKKIDKHRADCDSGEGHAKISKINRKREQDEGFSRASKKSKKQIIQSGDNGGATVEYQGNHMMVGSSGFGLATNTDFKDKLTNSEFFSSRKSKDDKDSDSLGTFDKSKIHAEGFPDVGSSHANKYGSVTIAPKKRKMDNLQDPASSTPLSGKLKPDLDECSRTKHRMSKSEGKVCSTSKRNGKAEKRSLNNTEPLPKDSSSTPPVVAATSGSSKVSGSLKAKSKFQELKGSPVESVSSSPFRISNSDKLTSGSKIMVENDNAEGVVKLATGSPRKCSDDDYQDGGGQSGFMRKADSLTLGKQTPEKSWKDFSSLSKDKNTMFKSDPDKGKVKMPESYGNPHDYGPVCEEKDREGKIKVPEKFRSNVDKDKTKAIYNNQQLSILKSKGQQDCDQKKSKSEVDKPEQLVSISARGKSKHLPASDGEKNEKSNYLRSKQGNGMNTSSADTLANDLSRDPKSNTKADTQDGTHHIPSKNLISNGRSIKNQEAPSPLRRDATSQAAGNAIKEAQNLKHLADRLKGGESADRTGLYFEAALKFLHGASLLESGRTENTKHADMLKSKKIYSDTAKLCEFCAHEYEKSKDLATAALAYKCMEVAYLRVIYSSHHSASKDRSELQTVLQMVPPGESPSSSASDIDNLNNSATMDKDLQARNGSSPQPAINLVIAAKNHPNFQRLLSFAQDVNFAMEASRKSRIAFAAANVNIDQEDLKDVISSIKRALDFNFHDVQGLLRLVRLAKDAKEATSR